MVFAIDLEIFRHLRSQFPGRFQDQGSRHARPRPALAEDIDHRQGKAGGLAGAGLGTAQDVASLQDIRYGALLNGRRFAIAGVVDGLQDGGA